MEWIPGIVLVVTLVFLLHTQKRKTQLQVRNILATQVNPETIKNHPEKDGFQFSFETERYYYLVKWVHVPPKNEVIVTNENLWCINNNPKGWKRSTKPNFIPGVASFRRYLANSTKPMKRIGLLFPDAHNITRYLNEADVEVVKVGDLAYGVYLVRSQDFAKLFAMIEQK